MTARTNKIGKSVKSYNEDFMEVSLGMKEQGRKKLKFYDTKEIEKKPLRSLMDIKKVKSTLPYRWTVVDEAMWEGTKDKYKGPDPQENGIISAMLNARLERGQDTILSDFQVKTLDDNGVKVSAGMVVDVKGSKFSPIGTTALEMLESSHKLRFPDAKEGMSTKWWYKYLKNKQGVSHASA